MAWVDGYSCEDWLWCPNLVVLNRSGVGLYCVCQTHLQCNFGHCHGAFHPSCARDYGLYMNVKYSSGGRVQYRAYCERHSPQQRAKVERQISQNSELWRKCNQPLMIMCHTSFLGFHHGCCVTAYSHVEHFTHYWVCLPFLETGWIETKGRLWWNANIEAAASKF